MDNIPLKLCDVIGPLVAESQSHQMIEDVHCPSTIIFRTLPDTKLTCDDIT